MKLLIVDDEPILLETVELKLQREGYSTFTAATAEDGMRLFRKVKPDLVILDIMLPQRSGYDVCRAIRKESSTPIIFVSARSNEGDRVKGLELGADDYLVKPFHLSELAARVKAVLRRSGSDAAEETVVSNNLVIDPQSHVATLADGPLDLSPKEFALLYFLARHAGKAFSRETLLDRVWGRDAYVNERTVDVHVRWLRKRIEPDPSAPSRIVTVRGIGYKFVA